MQQMGRCLIVSWFWWQETSLHAQAVSVVEANAQHKREKKGFVTVLFIVANSYESLNHR